MPFGEQTRLCNRWVWFFIEVVKSDFLTVLWFVIGLQFGTLAVIWLGKFNNNDGYLLVNRVECSNSLLFIFRVWKVNNCCSTLALLVLYVFVHSCFYMHLSC